MRSKSILSSIIICIKKTILIGRLNIIHNTRFSNGYDDDLRDEQVRRINAKIDEIEERIKELEEFKKEL